MRTLTLILLGLLVTCTAASAARVISQPIYQEPIYLYSAYPGKNCADNGRKVIGTAAIIPSEPVLAVPGVLSIDPGGITPINGWPNYVSAGKSDGPSDGLWNVMNVALRKNSPRFICTVPINSAVYYRQGSGNIQRWWPLMYEVPGTEWVLTISYKTTPWDDDGPAGPNKLATTHQDVWTWRLDANLDSMQNLVDLFYQLPIGSCGTPIISNEALRDDLINRLQSLKSYPSTDIPEYTMELYDLIMMIQDCCLTVDCGYCSQRAGIYNTVETPACCKLLAEAEYILLKTAIP
ncbi:MAG: hypothetical protein GX139_03100 [Armatimonadetes bacterium]|jgi:hypothetical protein|nr:hypothetical protein [Armatimonadota bacterium]